jgi:uncharacterized membrane protein YccC
VTVAERLAELAAALAEMRAAALEGAMVDLAGLDGAIEDALAAARAAPEGERQALLAHLAQLAGELDTLAAALGRQHHAGSQRRAAAAYRGTPPSPPASNDNS